MIAHSIPSDPELFRLAGAGSEEAFLTLYRRYQDKIYRFALQMCGSESIAEDITQEVFLTTMNQAANFDPTRGSVSAYLYGIARNQVKQHLERERRLVAISGENEGDENTVPASLVVPGDALGDLTRSEGLAALKQAILSLPVHYREAVVLCDLEEMSYVEAANALECAVGTIRSRRHRAHVLLVEKLRGADQLKPASERHKASRCTL
jgi:RNA polymerase sigma-70 factor (ECF subfamily)